jgi:citrate lyase subunit beta / citryl-CoA lyase
MDLDAPAVTPETARSFLFVPGSRPDRFAKANDSEADIIILDLEDAVAPRDKEEARREVIDWATTHPRCLVRVNGVGTPWIDADLKALRGTGVPLMLPKTESLGDLRHTQDKAVGSPIVALVETPLGVLAASALASSGLTVRLALGNVDLATALGVDPSSHSAFLHVRGSLVVASAAAGLASPVDGVTTQLDDEGILADDVAHARELGFGAKLCIHPRQVGVVNAAMSPSPEEVDWAKQVLSHPEGGVVVVDGAMVDPPVVERARRIIERSSAGD